MNFNQITDNESYNFSSMFSSPFTSPITPNFNLTYMPISLQNNMVNVLPTFDDSFNPFYGFQQEFTYNPINLGNELFFNHVQPVPVQETNCVNLNVTKIDLPGPIKNVPSNLINPIPSTRCMKSKRNPSNLCPCEGKDKDCVSLGCTSATGHYACPVCGIAFSRKNSMRRHVLTHIKLRPYHCTACCKGFYRSDIYKRHLSSKKCKRNYSIRQKNNPASSSPSPVDSPINSSQ